MREYISGSRRGDWLLLAALIAVLLITAYRLTVYCRVIVAEVAVERIDADGSRTLIELPEDVHRAVSTTAAAPALVAKLERRVREWARQFDWGDTPRDGARLEVTIGCVTNTIASDQMRRFIIEAAGEGDDGP